MKTNASEDSVKFQRYPVKVFLDLNILLIKDKKLVDVEEIVFNQIESLVDGKRGFEIQDMDVELGG